MKWFLAFLVMAVVSFMSYASWADGNDLDLSKSDQQLHAVASFAVADVSQQILRASGSKHPILYGALISLGAGLVKEVVDGEVSTGDLKANGVGVLSSSVFSYVINF